MKGCPKCGARPMRMPGTGLPSTALWCDVHYFYTLTPNKMFQRVLDKINEGLNKE